MPDEMDTAHTHMCDFLTQSVFVTDTAASGQEILLWTFGRFWRMRQKMFFCETGHFSDFVVSGSSATSFTEISLSESANCCKTCAAVYVSFLLAMTTKSLSNQSYIISQNSLQMHNTVGQHQICVSCSSRQQHLASSGDRMIQRCCWLKVGQWAWPST